MEESFVDKVTRLLATYKDENLPWLVRHGAHGDLSNLSIELAEKVAETNKVHQTLVDQIERAKSAEFKDALGVAEFFLALALADKHDSE